MESYINVSPESKSKKNTILHAFNHLFTFCENQEFITNLDFFLNAWLSFGILVKSLQDDPLRDINR